MPYNSLLVDHKRYSSRYQSKAFPDIIGLSGRAVRIAQQDERKSMFSGKLFVRLGAVSAYPDNLCAQELELFIVVSELARLSRAAPCEVFGVEIDNDVLLSSKIFQTDIVPFRSR